MNSEKSHVFFYSSRTFGLELHGFSPEFGLNPQILAPNPLFVIEGGGVACRNRGMVTYLLSDVAETAVFSYALKCLA